MIEQRGNPRYVGLKRHDDRRGGFGLWLPADWIELKMPPGQRGLIFSPYTDRPETVFLAEHHRLPYAVADADWPTLREGFKAGLAALPGIEIESDGEVSGMGAFALEARFTYLDEGMRRKRWIRTVYIRKRQITFIAQGATSDEFEYWLPMFYNTMMSLELI